MKKFDSQETKKFISKPLFDEKIILNKDPAWPRISVITPSFNQSQFLERTILSVLNQNYPNLEFIVIDGGSIDRSVEIIKKYEKYLSYWVSEQDKGQANAINKGFQKSTGKILAWLCSDDLYLPGALIKVGSIYAKNYGDLIYGNTYLVDKEDELIGEHRNVKFSNFFTKAAVINGIFSISQPSMFCGADFFRNVGGVNEKLCNTLDNDLIIKILLTNPRVAYIRDFISCERLHSARKTIRLKHIAAQEISAVRRFYSGTTKISIWDRLFAYFVKVCLFIEQGDFFWLINRAISGGILKQRFRNGSV